MKLKVISEKPKPYLKRIFIIKCGGGFVGIWRTEVEHEITDKEATEFIFELDDVKYMRDGYFYPRQWLGKSCIMDGNYFDVYIEHRDKHGKLNKTESLVPIPVDKQEISDKMLEQGDK